MRPILNTGPCGRTLVTINGNSPPPRNVKPKQPFSRSTVIWANFDVTHRLFCETEQWTDAMRAFNPIQLFIIIFVFSGVPFEWMIHDTHARMKWIIFGITYYSRVNSIRFQQQRLDHRSTVHSIHEHLSNQQLRCHQFDEYDRRAQENQLPVPVDSVHLLSADTINLCDLKIERTKKNKNGN